MNRKGKSRDHAKGVIADKSKATEVLRLNSGYNIVKIPVLPESV
jgi:hypothetical protein